MGSLHVTAHSQCRAVCDIFETAATGLTPDLSKRYKSSAADDELFVMRSVSYSKSLATVDLNGATI